MKYLQPYLPPASLAALDIVEAAATAALPEKLRLPNAEYYEYEYQQGRRYAATARDEDETQAAWYAECAAQHFRRVVEPRTAAERAVRD